MKTTILKRIKLLGLMVFLVITTQSCFVASVYPIYSDDVKASLEGLEGDWIGKNSEIKIVPKYDLEFKFKGFDASFVFDSKDNPTIKVVDKDGKEKIMPLKDYKGIKSNKGSVYHITFIEYDDKLKKKSSVTKKTSSKGKVNITTQIKKIYHSIDSIEFIGKLFKLDNQYYMDLILDKEYLERKITNIAMLASLLPVHLLSKIKFENDQLQFEFLDESNLKKIIKKSNVKLKFLERDRMVLVSKTKELQKFIKKYGDKALFDEFKEEGFRRKREK